VEEPTTETENTRAGVEWDDLSRDDQGLTIAYRCRLLREQGRAAIAEATAQAATDHAGTRWRTQLLPVAQRLRDTLGDLLD
jgi:hypothetical protein